MALHRHDKAETAGASRRSSLGVAVTTAHIYECKKYSQVPVAVLCRFLTCNLIEGGTIGFFFTTIHQNPMYIRTDDNFEY